MHVPGHDRHSPRVNGAQVGVLEETNEVGLGSFLERGDGSRLKVKVILVVLSNLPHEALEWQLANEELGALLVLADLSERYGARSEAVCLLDASSLGSEWPDCLLSSELRWPRLLPRRLAREERLATHHLLLCATHLVVVVVLPKRMRIMKSMAPRASLYTHHEGALHTWKRLSSDFEEFQ